MSGNISTPSLALPYRIRPSGAAVYTYWVAIPLAGLTIAQIERITALVDRLATCDPEIPIFEGVQAADAVVGAYEATLQRASDFIVSQRDEAWVVSRGSRRLQQGLARGFDMGNLYLEERLAADFPGLDATAKLDGAVWRDIGPEPTLRALETLGLVEAALEMGPDEGAPRANLVRLAEQPFGYRLFRERCWEAVIIRGWLGRVTVLVGIARHGLPSYTHGEDR